MQKRLKSFDDNFINYDIDLQSKKKDYIILIHGAGSDLNSWYRLRSLLKKDKISTIAIDLRGHGKSTRPMDIKDYNLDFFAKDIYEIIKKEKIKNFTMIGYCFGGLILQIFHKKYPKLAKSYVLIASTYKSDNLLKFIANIPIFSRKSLNFIFKKVNPNSKKFYHLDYSKYIGTKDWYFPRIFENILHTSIKSWMFTYKEFSKYNSFNTLKTINQKTLILHGDKDSAISVKTSMVIHKQIKNSKLKIFKNENHIILLNNPKLVYEEITKFIK